MNYPKISIVTPSFNQGQYIEQTIQSVIEQNYPNLEYIIIDGGSTDNTVDIIKKYESHITYWVSEKDKGQTHAINKGFSKCTGDIFNWLNSDDYYEPGALKSVANAFSDDVVKVVCGKEIGFYDNGIEEVIHTSSVIKTTTEETIFTAIIDQPCTFFKKKDIEDFYPLHTSLHYVMDKELWIRFLSKYGISNIAQIEKILTRFRLHHSSKSVSEATGFETEFSILKAELLKRLEAPLWLIEDTRQNIPGGVTGFSFNTLDIINLNKATLLSMFAVEYATRQYVKDNWPNAKKAMQYVKDIGRLNNTNWQQYFKTVVLPVPLLKTLKTVKSKIN
ncbi:MAG: glycosyltransferase family 2 protein [Ginsengibacter sp.]